MQDVNRAGLSVLEMPTASARGSLPPASTDICDFDLITYARKHRYRLRNLRDGGPVPPARLTTKHRTIKHTGYTGVSDRLDAIVGYCGALTNEHEQGLGIYLHYKTTKGVNRGIAGIKAMGGTVHQVGDFEVTGHVPCDRIEDALKLIRASKLKPGRPGFGQSATVQNAHAS